MHHNKMPKVKNNLQNGRQRLSNLQSKLCPSGPSGALAWRSWSRVSTRRINFGRNIKTISEGIWINLMIQMIKRITRPVAQAEINLTAILTSLIPMSAKEEGRKAPKSNAERDPSPSLSRVRMTTPNLPRASAEGRKKYNSPRKPN